MGPEHFQTVLLLSAFVWSVGAICLALRARKHHRRRLAVVGATALLIVGATVYCAPVAWPGRNSVLFLPRVLAQFESRHLVSAALGASMGFALIVLSRECAPRHVRRNRAHTAARLIAAGSVLSSFLFAGVFVLEPRIAQYLNQRRATKKPSDPAAYCVAEGFTLEEYYECDFAPIQIAVGGPGRLYIVGVHINPPWDLGVVARLVEDPLSGQVTHTILGHLNRPYGIAVNGDDLYVSRSGQHTRAIEGKLVPVNCGAITLIRDLDDDGVADYWHDVITDLPGSRLMGGLHQNSGIAFGPDQHLYITHGVPNDALPSSRGSFEGTILRCRPDGSELSIFACGLRNPFDLAFGPDGQLFCTDNDISSGDEFNHVLEGRHYGFPYADGARQPPDGTVGPLLVSKRGAFEGLAWADAPTLPSEYRDCFYIADYLRGEIVRVTLRRDGGTYRAERFPFAVIPGALDVVVDGDGIFYVSCFQSQMVYRITRTDGM